MKKLWQTGLAAIALVALLAAALAACGGGKATSMHLKRTEGTVGVWDENGSGLQPKADLGLYSGYGLNTEAESYAWVDFDKTKLAKLDQASEIAIAREGKQLTVEVKAGSFFFNVTEPLAEDEGMEICAANMLVGIRGTCGWVELSGAGGLTLYLLEGQVECAAGEATAAVSAGQRAAMTPDGQIEVSAFTAAQVPDFVVAELEGDEKLADAIFEASGIDAAGRALVPYQAVLDAIEGEILYTGLHDFEADGSPELLVLYQEKEVPGFGNVWMAAYREGEAGPVQIARDGRSFVEISRVRVSLVESGGRLFVQCLIDEGEEDPGAPMTSVSEHVAWFGSVAESEGGEADWGILEVARAHYYGMPERAQLSLTYTLQTWPQGPHEQPVDSPIGTAEEYAAVLGKYDELLVLAYKEKQPDGEDPLPLTALPDPAQLPEYLPPQARAEALG